MIRRLLPLALLPAALAAAPFEPTLESLSTVNPAPDWFRDAKIGIYFHWGVYSVPAFGSEWYPRNMHLKGRKEHQHHIDTWGSPAKFGYPDFVPKFTAEHFDAAEWAELFAQAGARFAGPVAEHHDGFAMWDSELTPWNAADMGPMRDITGELATAIRARGMKFVATFHHARNSLWEKQPGKWSGHYEGVKTNYPQLLNDPKRAILYGHMPREKFLAMWKGKLAEVIDNYQPDLIWFDSWLDEIPEQTRFEFAAHYLNRASEWGREVVITRKQKDLPLSFSLEDFEKGRAADLTENVWLTDDTISKGSWCFTNDLRIKEPDEVVDTMIDIVSKNGQLLLNISPMADGTIPDNQRAVLLAMGDWLRVNSEAIYQTRPWLAYGEGPTKMKKGGHFVGEVRYGARDIRYTLAKDGKTLYAILLGPPAGPVTLARVKAADTGGGAISLLGSDTPLRHEIGADGRLVIHPPAGQLPSPFAHAFRITGFDLTLAPELLRCQVGPARATLEGDTIKLETKAGKRENIGFWDDPADRVHWLLTVPKAGTWQIEVESSSTQPSALAFDAAGDSIRAAIPATGSWEKTAWHPLGEFEFPKAGVVHVTLRPADPRKWQAVNVFGLRATR